MKNKLFLINVLIFKTGIWLTSVFFFTASAQILEKTNSSEVVFSDDFEADFGWPKWKLETPVNNYNWNRTKYKVFAGEYSLWCAGKNLNDAPKINPEISNYPSPMDAYAILIDRIDLTNCINAEIVFNVWHRTDTGDYFQVLADYGNSNLQGHWFGGNSNGWEEKRLSFKDWPYYGNMLGLKVYVAIRFVTDGDGAVEKGVFLDNFQIIKYYSGQPDLYCSSLTVDPLDQTQGGTMTLSAVTGNMGNENSQPCSIHFYLSNDNTINPSEDYLLGSSNIPSLNAEATFEVNVFLLTPSAVADDSYYFGYVIDKDNTINDSNLNNNTGVLSERIVISTTTVDQSPWDPNSYDLSPCYPNPFNMETIIPFWIHGSAMVILDILNMKGERVVSLVQGKMSSGYHHIKWNGSSENSGIYIVYLNCDGRVKTQKIILNK